MPRGHPETRSGSSTFGIKNDFRMPRGNSETRLGSSIFETKNDLRKPPNTVWFRDFGSAANPETRCGSAIFGEASGAPGKFFASGNATTPNFFDPKMILVNPWKPLKHGVVP